MVDINLKPCPFCGGKAKMKEHLHTDGSKEYTVECALEFKFCPVIPMSWAYDTEQEVADTWNKRY